MKADPQGTVEAARVEEVRAELRRGRSYVTPGGLRFWPALDVFNSVVQERDDALAALRSRGSSEASASVELTNDERGWLRAMPVWGRGTDGRPIAGGEQIEAKFDALASDSSATRLSEALRKAERERGVACDWAAELSGKRADALLAIRIWADETYDEMMSARMKDFLSRGDNAAALAAARADAHPPECICRVCEAMREVEEALLAYYLDGDDPDVAQAFWERGPGPPQEQT